MDSIKLHHNDLICFLLICFLLLFISIALLTSCQKKNPILGKWNLIDEKISCTNSALDSLSKSKIGVFKSGNLLLKEEVEDAVKRGDYFIFPDDSKYFRKSGNFSDSGNYKIKDSHFIDNNNLELVEEITIRNKEHIHTYTLFLRKDPN